jgi:DNA gyrase subunit A
MAETIHPTSIVEETRRRYLTYAMSVITSRALPDVRDGLKPVQRRILYTMYNDLHLYVDAKPRKCSKIAGDVMGNYHPHGDMAIYDALVRMAQDWVLRYRLVDGQGNFGSVDGDPPAASRYTEARLTEAAEHLMTELKQQTVDFRDNYDGTQREPVVLPARFPNLLVNGTSGIAVGMATNIPPHNLGEVIRAAIFLIEEPSASVAQLLDRVKGPDFPLGGKVVTDRPTLRKIYEDGAGSIKVQAEWKVEKGRKGQQIIVTSIPYGVNKGQLELAIGEIIASRKLPQVTGLTNESNAKDGLRIALDLRPDTDPDLVMAYLYKHTALQEAFTYNVTCLVPSEDGTLQPKKGVSLKELLRYFLDFRYDTVRRRFEFELEQLRRRIHILQGFRIIFNALDEALKIIRASSGKQDASERLIARFKLDEIQATAILDAQLYKIAQLEIKKILDELKEKKAEAERIEGILGSKKKLWGVVKSELNDLGDKFPERRRTRIASGEEAPEFDEEAYIVRENTNVVLTRDGWIKRVGRLASVEGTRVREGDEVIAVVPGSTLDHVVFFADDGTAYTMRVNEVPASSGYGEPITKFFRLGDQVRVLNAVTTDTRFVPEEVKSRNGDVPGPYVLAVTAQGQTLRIPLAPYRTESTKVGRRYVRLEEGDRVVMASVLHGDEETIYLASASGHVIHFRIKEINVLASAGKGVMGIKLADGDTCLGGSLMSGRFDKFTLEMSNGKTMEFGRNKYEVTSRGGKGFEAVKRLSFVRVLPHPIELVNWDEIEGKEPKANGNGNGKNGHGESRTLFE